MVFVQLPIGTLLTGLPGITGPSEQSRDADGAAESCVGCEGEEGRDVTERIKSPRVLRKTQEID